MGTVDYILDLLHSFRTDILQGKLSTSAIFHDRETITHSPPKVYRDICIAKSSRRITRNKYLEIYFYENYNTEVENGYYIKINEKNVNLLTNKGSTEILSSDEMFNISIMYDIPFTYDDLKLIQRNFKKVVKKRNITQIVILYTKGEEKQYGY